MSEILDALLPSGAGGGKMGFVGVKHQTTFALILRLPQSNSLNNVHTLYLICHFTTATKVK